MEFTFTLSKKDYWAYNNFSILHVKQIRQIFLITPILVFVASISTGLLFHLNMWVCGGLAVGLPAFYILSVYIPMSRGIMKISNDKLVEQTIKIDAEKKQIIQTIGGKQKKYNKTNIMQVKCTKAHVFITMYTFSALIIPVSDPVKITEVVQAVENIC